MAFVATETALGSTTSWTSDKRLTNRDDNIVGTIFSDTAGSLFVEQGYTDSSGTDHWDASTTVAVTASTGTSFTVPIVAANWRLRFTQAGTQTVFRVYGQARASGVDG
jgi:hypothetical protein